MNAAVSVQPLLQVVLQKSPKSVVHVRCHKEQLKPTIYSQWGQQANLIQGIAVIRSAEAYCLHWSVPPQLWDMRVPVARPSTCSAFIRKHGENEGRGGRRVSSWNLWSSLRIWNGKTTKCEASIPSAQSAMPLSPEARPKFSLRFILRR
jgi:hypothetical protein